MKRIYWSFNLLLFTLIAMNSNGYSQCAPVITGPATVCVGTIVRYHAYSTTPGNLTWSINGGGTLLGGSLNPPNPQINWTTPSVPGTPWRITVTNSACPATPTIYYVTVVNSSTISAPTQITGPASTCGGNTSTYSVPPIAGLTPVWLITSVNPLGTPLPVLTPTGNQVSIIWPASSGFYNLFASYTNGTCSGMQISKLISVSTGITPISISGNGTDKFCVGQSYTFTASGEQQDSYTWSLTGGGILTPNGNQATVQWTTQGPSYTLTATATSSCNATPRTASRTLEIGPSAPNAPGVISKQNTITCVNQTERFSVAAVSGATSYQWTLVASGTFYYTTSVPYLDRSFSSSTSGTVSVIASNGYCNSPPSPTFSFNVGLPSMQSSFPTAVCVGTPATFSITSTGDMSNFTFTWNVQDGEIIGPSTGSSISVKWNSTGSRTVSAHISTPCGLFHVPGPPSLPSPTYVQGTTTMLTPITGTSQVCLGQYSYYATAEAGTRPTWSLTLQGGGATSGGTISQVQFVTYVNWNTPGNYTLTATATNSCGVSQSQSLNVTVASGPKPTTSQINGQTYETICTSTLPITRSYSVPLTAGYSYAWELYSSPTNTLTSSNNTATVTWNQTGSSNIYVTPSTVSCSGERTYMNSTLNLNSAVGVLSSSLSPTICGFSVPPINLSLTSSTGTVTYQVRKKGDNGAWTAWTNISSLPYTLDFSGVSAFVAYYFEFQAMVQNSSCAAVYSNTVPLTVYILPYINNNSAQDICSGTNVAIVPTSTIAGSTFSWTSTVTGPITGATASGTGNISDILTNTGSVQGTVVYTVTPSSNGCNGNPVNFTRYVYPKPALALNQVKSVCSGQNVNYDILVTPSGSSTEFNWPDPDGVGPATAATNKRDYSGSNITDVLTNTSTSPITVTYQVTPLYRVTTSMVCTGTTSNVVITVNPKPSMTSLNTGSACSSVPLNHILTSSVPSTYSWIAANNGNTTGESTTLQNSGVINNTIVNLATSPQTVVYTVTPTSTAGTCLGTAQSVSITVNPAPIMTSPTTSIYCSGVQLNHPFTSNIGSTFTWVAADNPYTFGESLTPKTGGAINDIIINTTTTNQIVTYTVTPTSSAGACIGAPQTLNITIKPSPGLSSSLNPPAVCSGSLFTYVPVNSVSGSTFSWSRAAVSGITPATASGTGNINETLTSTNTVPTNVAYVFSMVANGCTSSSTVTLTVNPKPSVFDAGHPMPTTICSGQSTNIAFSSNVSGATFTWSVLSKSSNIAGVTVGSSGTSNPIVHPLTNSSTTPGTVVYRITPSAYSCVGSFMDKTITVNPSPVATITPPGSTTTICMNQVITLSANTGSGLTYQWYKDGNSRSNNSSITIYGHSDVGQYDLVVTNQFGCYSGAQKIIAVDIPNASVTPSGNVTVCPGNSITFQSANQVGHTYTWQKLVGASTWNTISTSSSYTTSTIGKYRVIATRTSSGCTNTGSEITLSNLTAAIPTISIVGSVCDSYVTLSAYGSGATSYQWSTSNTSQTVNMLSSGTYTVTAFYPNGCSRISNPITITIPTCDTDPCDPYASPVNGRVPDLPCYEEIQKTELIIEETTAYPNPADAEIIVHLPAPAEYDIPVKMYSQFGHAIHSMIIQKGESKVELKTSDLTGGIYLIQIQLRGQKSFNRKVLVAHNR